MTDAPFETPPPDPPQDAAPKDRVRDAATVILVRRDGPEPRILMGQRGKHAAFMPSKFVFPGGAVDADDSSLTPPRPLQDVTRTMLCREAPDALADPLGLAAIRELWEETGLALAHPLDAPPPHAPPSWTSFFDAGHAPACDQLALVFRAITPPGRPRRFDARFFLVEASAIRGDLDDFSRASDELSHLHWVALSEARGLDLPFITEVVLGEVANRLRNPDLPRPAPFFHHDGGRSFLTGL
ncbi:MAG: NUDIX hydrolase [Pseudomonadota bacterium]